MSHHATYAVPTEHLDVVVIDDSKTMLTILRSVLNGLKVRRVRLFDSTEAALHGMLNEPPNLIICEWKSGLVSAQQLLRMIRARFMEPLCYVPVIVLTATPTRAIIDRAMAGGANLIVVKPISPAVLQERITWLQRDQRKMILGPRGAFEIEGVRETMTANLERAAAVRKVAASRAVARPERPAEPIVAPTQVEEPVDQWQAFLKTKEQLQRKAGVLPDDKDEAEIEAKRPQWASPRRR